MTALDLVLAVKRRGVRFSYQGDGSMMITGAERLPDRLRQEFLNRVDDCRAVVAENSISSPRAIDVVDAARGVIIGARRAKALR